MSIPSEPRVPRWREPTSLLPLRWGTYRARVVAGVTLLIVGTACVLLTSAYSLPFLLTGSLMQPAGWAVMPSTIGRRVAVPLPALGFTWLMLGGSGFAWCWAILLTAWLLVRMRPLPSYLALAVPIASSLVLGSVLSTNDTAWITALVSSIVVVGSAWLARWIAVAADSWQAVRTLRKQADTLD